MPVATATIQFMHYVKKIAANVPMNQIGIILWVDACISVRRLREPRLMMPMLSAKLEECDMALCWPGRHSIVHNLIRAVLIQSCPVGAKNFTNYVSGVIQNIEMVMPLELNFEKKKLIFTL